MTRQFAHTLIVLCALLIVATPAAAAVPASSPDDICAPTDDPCVVDDHYEVVAPGGVLDFGLRAVHIVQGGKLEKTVSILSGDFLIDVGPTTTAINSNEGAGESGSVTIRARRACSGDSVTPCLDDTVCAGGGLGTCSVGAGTLVTGGEIFSRGDPGGIVIIEAAGDITIDDTINASGLGTGTDGGKIEIESFMGSVVINGKLNGNAGTDDPYNFAPCNAGGLFIDAAVDITMNGKVELTGGTTGGYIYADADRDLIVSDDINCNAAKTMASAGGSISLRAQRDLILTGSGNQGSGETRFSTTGGSRFYYYATYSGYGGYQYFHGENIDMAQQVTLESKNGEGSGVCSGASGDVCFTANGGTINIDGRILVDARGSCDPAGTIQFFEGASVVRIGEKARFDMQGKVGGDFYMDTHGKAYIYGDIDLHGRPKTGDGYYYSYYGSGGQIRIRGDLDLTVGGKILSGSDNGSLGNLLFDVCRMTVTSDGFIDHTNAEPAARPNFQAEDNVFRIRESMYVAPGSKIFAADSGGGRNLITYRDINKPPVLLGTMDPPPILNADPSLVGCPVCGNSEIDQGESCDDGNETSGDGCRDDCQDEGCITETPGYPGVSLCDDGDACTLDTCDPVAHQCNNPVSCEEGVLCTIDFCDLGACQHTPDDALCDDDNVCTDDLCNAVTGCVYADLTGPDCEDGDICTVTDVCDNGTCIVGDKRYTSKNKISVKLKTGAANDSLKAKFQMPLEHFGADPTVTGLHVELFDETDQSIYDADLEATDWEDQRGDGTAFRFRDTQGPGGPANGVSSAKIKSKASLGVAKFIVKMKTTEVPGALDQTELSFSVLFGTDASIDDCLTARRIPCKIKPTKTSCRD